MSAPAPLPPGSRIGILGGGQLGRMIAIAAAELGYRCHVFCPEEEAPAADVAAAWTKAGYADQAALRAFAGAVDVITLEFENIPADCVAFLAALKPVRPGAEVLRITQDRLLEKDFARALGLGTAPYAPVGGAEEAGAAAAAIPGRAVLKTRRFGYDGKGQRLIAAGGDRAAAIRDAWAEMGSIPCILEGFVDFRCELSVIAARGQDGAIACFVPVENRHRQQILDLTIAPARLPAPLLHEAEEMARRIAGSLDLCGTIAVEMFLGRDGRLLVNELAPRVHNSGHWTIEACLTSQFQQHVRAICGLPLGSPARHADATMRNLIGDDADRWAEILKDPANRLHLYGKSETRPGRKMGHVTRLLPLGAGSELADF